jgi:hypothetical protein
LTPAEWPPVETRTGSGAGAGLTSEAGAGAGLAAGAESEAEAEAESEAEAEAGAGAIPTNGVDVGDDVGVGPGADSGVSAGSGVGADTEGMTSRFDRAGFESRAGRPIPPDGSDSGRDGCIIPPKGAWFGDGDLRRARFSDPPRILRRADERQKARMRHRVAPPRVAAFGRGPMAVSYAGRLNGTTSGRFRGLGRGPMAVSCVGD